MRALTVRRPWAQLIMLGIKNIENRTWSTDLRGPLVIHAAQRWEAEGAALAQALHPDRDDALFLAALDRWQASVGYLGLVQLSRICRQTVDTDGASCDCGPWAVPGHYHWILTDPQAFRAALPGPGGLGLRRVPPEVQRIVRRVTSRGENVSSWA
jgi:hypothetical protein